METKIITCSNGDIREYFYCLNKTPRRFFLNNARIFISYESYWKRWLKRDTFEITCFEKHKRFFNIYVKEYKNGMLPFLQVQMNRTNVQLIFKQSEIHAVYTDAKEKQVILDIFELCYNNVGTKANDIVVNQSRVTRDPPVATKIT